MITYNVFSNIISGDIRNFPIYKTLRSAIDVFKTPENTVFQIYIHPFPFENVFFEYCDAICQYFPSMQFHFHRTRGLADGYRQSIINAQTPYVFQIEHDWYFLKEHIHHSLEEICYQMRDLGLDQVGFSSRTLDSEWIFKPHKKKKQPRIFTNTPHPDAAIALCHTSLRGNASSLLDVEYFKEHLVQFIDPFSYAAYGVEEVLNIVSPSMHLYGPLHHPATMEHLDGKAVSKKEFCKSWWHRWLFHHRKQKGKHYLKETIRRTQKIIGTT